MPNGANSKKPSVGRPLSAKMPIARILAGVPIKVIAPPSSDEKERGMSSLETGILVRRAMATTAGMSIAVAPTLFIKPDATVTRTTSETAQTVITAGFAKPSKISSGLIRRSRPTDRRTSSATRSTRSFSVAKSTRAARMMASVRAISVVIRAPDGRQWTVASLHLC